MNILQCNFAAVHLFIALAANTKCNGEYMVCQINAMVVSLDGMIEFA